MKKTLLILSICMQCLFLQAQSQTADGYRGIWYSLGQFSAYGDKYSGGLGTYTADHTPTAAYVSEVEKTFFLYGGTPKAEERHLQICIGSFDHRKNVVSRPVVVCDKKGVDDPHDNGSLCITPDGHIWVFVSGRNVTRLGQIFRSRKPYDISDFEEVYQGVFTYPQPYYIEGKGFLLLFTQYTAPKTRGRELYCITSQDGKKWSAPQKIAAIEGHYQISVQHGNHIVTAFNYHPKGSADTRTNLYVMQTEDMGKTWTTVDGKELETPLTDAHNPALVDDLQKDGKLLYLNDMNFDQDGNPAVLAVVSRHYQPGPQGNPREWTLYRYNRGKWDKRVVCTSTHNYDMGSLYVEGYDWRIIGPTEPGPQHYGTGGEIALWRSRDNGFSWQRERLLTRQSTYNHSYVRRPLNAHPQFYGFWADGDADKLSPSHLYFCDKDGLNVWQLPYEMDADEKPILADKPFGVNLAGAEFAEAHLPGEYGHDYQYPTIEDMDYYHSKGLSLIRIPFKWERMQPRPMGELDVEELQRLKNVIVQAGERGMQVIVDLHNYARRIVDGEKYLIGTEQLTTSHFSNFWSRLSAALRQYKNIYGYGLMNEPHDIDNHAVSWFMMAQEAILAIRQQDMAHSVIVGGDCWSSAERWLEYSDNLRLLYDPARMLMFEAHVYFDRDASGTYRESYDDSGCTVETGVKRVRPFVEWLKQNQLNGFVGEYGVPDNDERWLETLDRFLEYLQANGVNATYWAGGNRWGNYKLRISPTKGLDRPQMKIVEKYLYAHQ